MNIRPTRLLRGVLTAAALALLIGGLWLEGRRELARSGLARPRLSERVRAELEAARRGYLRDPWHSKALRQGMAQGVLTAADIRTAIELGRTAREQQIESALADGFPPELIRGRPGFTRTFAPERIAEAARARRKREVERVLTQVAAGRGYAARDIRVLNDALERGLATETQLAEVYRAGRRSATRSLLASLESGSLPVLSESSLRNLLRYAECDQTEAERYTRLWERLMRLRADQAPVIAGGGGMKDW